MTFLDIAAPLAGRGLPVIRLRPRTKIPSDSGWPETATDDLETIVKWNAETPDANVGVVAKAVAGQVWFLEQDTPPDGVLKLTHRIEAETGNKIPETYMVRSRPGRGHYYFRQTPESIAMGNIAQSFVKFGDWSARVSNEMVVGAGSLHPISGQPYVVLKDVDIVPAPTWLIEWLLSQKTEKEKLQEREPGKLIPHGMVNGYLVSLIGGFRNKNIPLEAALQAALAWAHENVEPPVDERIVERDVRGMYKRYEAGTPTTSSGILIGGVPVGAPQTAYGVEPARAQVSEIEIPNLVIPPYPKFPRWVMEDTSIYKGLVKPYCDVNTRYPEYMFVPAMTILLNYIARKVEVKGRLLIPSIFTVLIGKRGEIVKSSSVQSAIEYFRASAILDHAGEGKTNANGKSMIWEIGSPEGLGIQMQKLKCRNAILLYDELATLANKAGIDGSALSSKLLTMYESGNFQNTIKATKDSYSFEPNSYCISLIACCTDKNFLPLWSKLSGASSGLNDRFFFLFQPEKLFTPEEKKPYNYINTMEAAMETRKLIEKAIEQRVFEFANESPLTSILATFDNREEIRVEKFALGFAVDMGLSEIDLECIERGIALVEYEKAVKKWLGVGSAEASSREGAIQLEVRNILVRNRGRMAYRDLIREVHADRHGTTIWSTAYMGLVKSRMIVEQGTGHKGDPKYVILIEAPQDDD